MSKFYGAIGFAETKETAPGVWTQEIVERNYYGDVTRSIRKWDQSGKVNDDLTLNNEISLVADPYAYNHFHTIRYVSWCGVKWRVNTIEARRPRLIMQIGGVYDEPETGTPSDAEGDSGVG